MESILEKGASYFPKSWEISGGTTIEQVFASYPPKKGNLYAGISGTNNTDGSTQPVPTTSRPVTSTKPPASSAKKIHEEISGGQIQTITTPKIVPIPTDLPQRGMPTTSEATTSSTPVTTSTRPSSSTKRGTNDEYLGGQPPTMPSTASPVTTSTKPSTTTRSRVDAEISGGQTQTITTTKIVPEPTNSPMAEPPEPPSTSSSTRKGIIDIGIGGVYITTNSPSIDKTTNVETTTKIVRSSPQTKPTPLVTSPTLFSSTKKSFEYEISGGTISDVTQNPLRKSAG